ncbi:MAG: peptidylprolyl isomerase [Luminiphilus sp.]|nr:peptidylprolyl isomerase [Luminiphilus sp.]
MPLRAENQVFYQTSAFDVTRFDLDMYLRNARRPEGDSALGSRERVLQALSDLYAAQVIAGDADAEGEMLLSTKEAEWIAAYEVRMEKIRRYLVWRVAAQIEQTDWQQEALEQYLGKKSDYVVPEAVSLRTFIIRTDNRSEGEAIDFARSLAKAPMTEAAFEAVVREHTEDKVAAENGGLMTDITRGQTVPPFEQAAFAMRVPGEISDPIVSEYGVHVIQLIRYRPVEQLTFKQAREDIISDLKATRPLEYRAAIQSEARERKGEGFVEYTEALDALMLETTNGPLGPP